MSFVDKHWLQFISSELHGDQCALQNAFKTEQWHEESLVFMYEANQPQLLQWIPPNLQVCICVCAFRQLWQYAFGGD